MKNKQVKQYLVMSKFTHSDDNLEYFLFEQSVAYNNKEEEYEDSIPF